ncbi:MAG: hypothetical protein U1E53_17855 [Dongiaceae bacterium]
MRIAGAIVLLVALLGLGGVAAAADSAVGPQAFYGRYKGTAVTQDPNAASYGFGDRDLDVEIGPAENGGFFVAWTTVIHPLSGKEPARSSARVTFEPSPRPGIYAGHWAPDMAKGIAWAAIAGKVLRIRLLTILDDGTYEIQSYDRALDAHGLTLLFRSDRDGTTVKMVSALLEKQGAQ